MLLNEVTQLFGITFSRKLQMVINIFTKSQINTIMKANY